MQFTRLTDSESIIKLISYHNANSKYVVLDLETTSTSPREAKLIDIQMTGYEKDAAVLFDAEHLSLLQALVVPLVFHNYKYDVHVAFRHGVDLRSKRIYDTMLLSHLVDENRDSHSLDAWVQELWGDDYKKAFWAKYDSYEEAPADERLTYACKDIAYTGRLYSYLRHCLAQQSTPEALLEHVHRLSGALLDTEIDGIQVDLAYTVEMGTHLKQDITKTEEELRTLAGHHVHVLELRAWQREMDKRKTPKGKAGVEPPEFNFASTPQVLELLYGRLGLKPVIDRKTKRPTADDKALESLESKHPIIPKIRQLRKYSKMYGAFIEGILERADGDRIYPSFNVNGTVTGRISHSEPNMGQMPAKGEWAKVRGMFVPSHGHKLITCDYGQLEVCLAAHFSQDTVLLDLIRSGQSMHDKTTEELAEFGVTRSQAKSINFGILYGALEYKISQIVGCTQDQAKDILEKFWSVYKGLKTVIFECHRKVESGEPIISPFGRRRRFPSKFANKWELEAAKRQAFNSLLQGTGADLTSKSFYLVSEHLNKAGTGRGLFTVHDELVIESKSYEADARVMQDTMVQAGKNINLLVDLTVDCSDALDRWQK